MRASGVRVPNATPILRRSRVDAAGAAEGRALDYVEKLFTDRGSNNSYAAVAGQPALSESHGPDS